MNVISKQKLEKFNFKEISSRTNCTDCKYSSLDHFDGFK